MRLPTIGLVVGKKKVWSRLVYLDGGSGIPMLQINIPHTRIVEYGIEHPNNHTIQSDECDAFLVALKIFQISIQGQKLIHFHQQNMSSPKGDLTKVWFFVKNAKSQCKVTRAKGRKGRKGQPSQLGPLRPLRSLKPLRALRPLRADGRQRLCHRKKRAVDANRLPHGSRGKTQAQPVL